MIRQPSKDAYLKIYCNAEQKRRIQKQTEAVGAKSVSDYALTVLLNGETRDYDGLRYKADGMLVNAATYQKLGELVEVLQKQVCLDRVAIDAVVSLIHEVRLEIATRRFTHEISRFKDEN